MTKNKQFSILSTVLSAFVIWLYIVTQIPPTRSDVLLMGTFFVSLTVWLGSIFAYTLYRYKVKRGNREIVYAHLKPSIRQGFLIALSIAILLYLQLLRVISIWDASLVIILIILLELGFRYQPLRSGT